MYSRFTGKNAFKSNFDLLMEDYEPLTHEEIDGAYDCVVKVQHPLGHEDIVLAAFNNVVDEALLASDFVANIIGKYGVYAWIEKNEKVVIDYEGFFKNFSPLEKVEDDADFVLKVFDKRDRKNYIIAAFKDSADEITASIGFISFAKEYFNIDVDIERV